MSHGYYFVMLLPNYWGNLIFEASIQGRGGFVSIFLVLHRRFVPFMHLQDSLFQFFLCCIEGLFHLCIYRTVCFNFSCVVWKVCSIYAFTGHFINITVDSLFQFDLLFLLLGSINESTDIWRCIYMLVLQGSVFCKLYFLIKVAVMGWKL